MKNKEINKKQLLKYKTAIDGLATMERIPVYSKNKVVGRLIGIELNNIYCPEIMVCVESLDYQKNFNMLLKDISFNKSKTNN